MTALEGISLLNLFNSLLTQSLVSSEGFHFVVTISIPVNRMTVRLEGNIGQCAGGGSAPARGRCEGVDP
jgi:hypothetical protein